MTNYYLLLTVQLVGLNAILSSSHSWEYHEGVRGSEGRAPMILNVHNKCMYVIGFTPTERHRSESCDNKQSLLLSGIERRFLVSIKTVRKCEDFL
jgi:hypothetical protein